MPLRDVMIRLGLNTAPYVAGIKQAQAATGKLGADITRTAAGGSKSASVLGSSFGLVGLAAGAAAVKMVSAAADFEQGMSNVKATGADAAKNIGALKQAALDAGNATKYSATEAAGGIEALAKAGVSSRDVLGGGLSGALSLAAAGNLDVAGSAEAAASAMNQFRLAGKDVPHIADLLAAGAGKAQGEVSDMAMALNQAGLIAHGAGASIEETTGTLAAFASAGLTGSDAGTSFKTMLQRLQAPTDKAAALMKKYNVSLYDGKGRYQGLSTVAGQLRENMAGLSEKQRSAAFAIIFGTDAVRGANVLYEQGEGGIKKWTHAVDDAGYAADVAREKQNNLKGDLEKLKGTVDTLFISGGEGPNSGIRPLVRGLDDLIKKLHEADTSTTDFKNRLSGGIFAAPFLSGRAFGLERETGVDRKVIYKLEVLGEQASVRSLVRVARAAGLTPRQVRSVLTLLGWSPRKIDAVSESLRNVRRRSQVRAFLQTMGFTTKDIDAVDKALQSTRSKADVKAQLQLQGFDPAIIEAILSLLTDVDRAKPKPKADLKDNASGPLSDIFAMLTALDGKTSTVTVNTVKTTTVKPAGGGALEDGSLHGSWGPRARGAMSGPGTGTSDSIPAMLSNGEHVLTASDVRMAGGQDAIFRLRAGIQSGALAFASGGPVGMSNNQWQLEIARLQADMADNRSQLKTAKGAAARRVLQLEYNESKAALRRLRAGLQDDPFSAIREAMTSPVGLFDSGSDSPWFSGGGGFAARASQKLTQIKTFAGKLRELKKAGLGGAVLSELASLGAVGGIQAADELLHSSKAELRQLNAAYAGIQDTQGYVAAFGSQGGANVKVSIEGFTLDWAKQSAAMRVLIRDEAGRVVDQQSFETTVHS